MEDFVIKRRRRGARLEAEILDAAWEELTIHGWSGLRMDAVAARAGTGKTSVYNRWPTKAHLVRAAAERAAATRTPAEFSGDFREDLRRILTANGEAVDGPIGEALRGIVAEARLMRGRRDRPSPLFDNEKPIQGVLAIVEVAQSTGEFRPGPVLDGAVNLGITLSTHHYLMTGHAPDDSVRERILALWLAALEPSPSEESAAASEE